MLHLFLPKGSCLNRFYRKQLSARDLPLTIIQRTTARATHQRLARGRRRSSRDEPKQKPSTDVLLPTSPLRKHSNKGVTRILSSVDEDNTDL
ncbi:jg10060 [Pararge aegeria aegeria]|uniref:Jg10060 protein n=1 Tax=Pararge aegeria aegeria TaxID=348720 RepID=A0A8S4SJN6_9NEOP|nr:jg10060 [Pararge aegeria aegeria]